MILVTGATGCLGSNLVRHLVESGERIVIFRRPDDPQLLNLGAYAREIEHRLGDVLDCDSVRAALRGVRRLYHIAGVSLPLAGLRDRMFKVNVGGTDSVMAAAKACGVERVVFTSSSSTIGIPSKGKVADENHQFNGDAFRFPYMHSKRQAEDIVLRYASEGLDAVVVNPTAVMAPVGDDRRGSWAATISAIKEGRLPFYPSGGLGITTRLDMIDGHVKAMANGRCGQRYILNSANLTYRDLSRLIADVVGVTPPRIQIPDALLYAVGAINSAIDLLRRDPMSSSLLSRDNTALLTQRVYYDQSKAVAELGVSQTPIRTAIEEVYAAWRQNSETGKIAMTQPVARSVLGAGAPQGS
jgi:dihydroflavonol-4-reductase